MNRIGTWMVLGVLLCAGASCGGGSQQVRGVEPAGDGAGARGEPGLTGGGGPRGRDLDATPTPRGEPPAGDPAGVRGGDAGMQPRPLPIPPRG